MYSIKKIIFFVVLSLFISFIMQGNVKSVTAAEIEPPSGVPAIPYYFLAIHNEPAPPDSEEIAENYLVLTRMVQKADEYNIKLTLMFTAQWGEYIAADPNRLAMLQSWESNGHEIAAHHHSIYHKSWDGYSNYAEELVLQVRDEYERYMPFLGTLDDYMDILQFLNPDMKSGCMNDETDKHALPDEIIYDTCSGFANFGRPGQKINDTDPHKGVNYYISIGFYKGIQRLWLTHFQTTSMSNQLAAQEVFRSMDSGVYGSVNHSSPREQEAFFAYISFLHEQDPTGDNSRTVSSIIEGDLLVTRYLDIEFRAQYLCGDRVCDEFEQQNPNICPVDCE